MNAKINLLILCNIIVLLTASACSVANVQQTTPLKLPTNSTVSNMPTPAPDWQLHNRLSRNEKADGFILLFDGKTTTGWRGFNQADFPPNWLVDKGTLHMIGENKMTDEQKAGRADIVYHQTFSNFILKLEWKISNEGNSGIFYLGNEKRSGKDFDFLWETAPEMQILDNETHPDAKKGKNGNRLAGSLYDLVPATPQNAHSVGQWNQIEIHVNDRRVKHIQNGEVVVSYTMDTPEWKALINNSKFSSLGTNWENVPTLGLIGLQDHGDPVWFRNIKLKPL